MDHSSDSEETATHKKSFRFRLRRISMRWRRAARAAARRRLIRNIAGVCHAFSNAVTGNAALCILGFLHPGRAASAAASASAADTSAALAAAD